MTNTLTLIEYIRHPRQYKIVEIRVNGRRYKEFAEGSLNSCGYKGIKFEKFIANELKLFSHILNCKPKWIKRKRK